MDETGFKKQFLPLHPRLYRIAFALTENSQDAEDILQEAYCRLWQKRKELPEIRNPEAFCITMIKNLCYDFLRSTHKNENEEINEQLTLSSPVSPETEAIQNDSLSLIHRLIEHLPENQRQVIRLRSWSDCTMEEIEEITGLNAGHVRVLLSRARKVIREQYEKLVSDE